MDRFQPFHVLLVSDSLGAGNQEGAGANEKTQPNALDTMVRVEDIGDHLIVKPRQILINGLFQVN